MQTQGIGFISNLPLHKGKSPVNSRKTICASYANIAFSPLNGRRVAFTTQQGYATRFAALLTDAGARPVWCPAVETKQLSAESDFEKLDGAVLALHEYDIVVFTQRETVHAFSQRMLKWAEGDPETAQAALNSSGVKLAALGRDAFAVKQMLRQPPHITPIDPTLPGLVHHLQGTDALNESHILCLSCAAADLTESTPVNDFVKALEHGGAHVERVDACRILPTKAKDTELERKQILAGDIDVLAMTSFEETEAFAKLVPSTALPDEMLIAVLGNHAEFGARCAGYDVDVVSSSFSQLEGLIERIGKAIEKKNPPSSLILPS